MLMDDSKLSRGEAVRVQVPTTLRWRSMYWIAERRIDGGLIGIGGGPGQVVHGEAREELVLVGDLLVDAQENWSALVATFEGVA